MCFVTNLRDTGRVVTFRSEVAKMKASRWLNEHVTFIDPEGVEIDPALLSPKRPTSRMSRTMSTRKVVP